MQFQPSARIRILEKSPRKCGLSITILNSEAAIQGGQFQKASLSPMFIEHYVMTLFAQNCFVFWASTYSHWNKPQSVSKQQTSEFYGDFVHFFSSEMAEHQSMGHLDSHVIFNRALFARQSCVKSKRIPLRLQRASYRAHYWVTTAQNWCRVSATEIGRKIAKTTRDVKMFNVL